MYALTAAQCNQNIFPAIGVYQFMLGPIEFEFLWLLGVLVRDSAYSCTEYNTRYEYGACMLLFSDAIYVELST